MSTSQTEVADRSVTAPTALQRARMPLLLGGLLAAVAFAAFAYVMSGRFESTDDAYVMAARVAVSSNVAGRVIDVAVRDNQPVRSGDVLFRLDDAPFRISVEEAQAQLAAARLQIEVLKANYLQRQSELALAQETVAFQRSELNRYRRLLKSGIASQAQIDSAAHALEEARSRIAGLQYEMAAVAAQLGGDPGIAPDHHPTVLQARAALERAQLQLSYTIITAPSDGIVTRVERLQVGSYVAASQPVFALVSTQGVWLEANFKEDQLAQMRVGQPATIQIDSYPGVKLTGKVASLSPGTGSQFSVLPPENATGNWVKVVQRLPVRIEFDEHDFSRPLHSGLSAVVRVHTHQTTSTENPADRAATATVRR